VRPLGAGRPVRDPADSLLAAFAGRPAAVWVTCAVIAALSLAAELARPATADMGVFLYAAARVLDGARLYRDVVEINPPLIIALNVPIVLLARATHLPEFLLYRLATAALIAALLVYQGRTVHRYLFPDELRRARYLTLLLCFALFALARIDFGQREHFVLALLLPYLLLVGAELRGRRPPSLEAGAIGALAAIAVALKPHFGLVWLVLEGFRRVRASPVERWRITPEMAGMLGFLAAYVLLVLWLTPDYLAVAALLGPAYATYMREPFANLLVMGPGAPLIWFALLAFVVLRRQTNHPELCALLAWAVVSCFIAGAAQQKEFRYHFYPALGLAFVLLGLLAADIAETARLKSERLYGRVSRALLVAIVVVVVGSTAFEAIDDSAQKRKQQAELLDLVAAVRARAGGRPVGVLSYTIESAFPLMNYAEVPLAMRFPGLWPFAASYWDSIASGGALRYHTVGQMPPAERYFFGAVQEDLLAAQPKLLLMLRPARDAAANGLRRLHYMQYFGRDPKLAVFFSRFELVGQKGEYLLYQRRESALGPVRPAPSAAPATLDARPAPELRDIGLGQLDPESLFGLGVFVISWMVGGAVRRRRRLADGVGGTG
jgi:hypothetical protein